MELTAEFIAQRRGERREGIKRFMTNPSHQLFMALMVPLPLRLFSYSAPLRLCGKIFPYPLKPSAHALVAGSMVTRSGQPRR